MEKEILEKILLDFSSSLFWASVILLIGILIAKIGERISLKFLAKIKLNSLLKRIGFEEILKNLRLEINLEKLIAQIIKWFFIILFLMESLEILKLEKFSQFLGKVIDYFPNIFVSVLIFIVFSFIIDLVQKTFIVTLEKGKIVYSKFFGKGTSFFLWALALLAILYQLKIVPHLILILFFGLVFALSLAIGISFGLGGKEFAQKFLRDLEEKLK